VSLPVPRGLLVEGQTMIAVVGGKETQAAVRPLTWHPQEDQAEKSVRRALLSFPFTFADAKPVEVVLKPAARQPEKPTVFPATVEVNGDTVTIAYDGGPRVKATLLGPPRASSEPPRVETVESHEYFLWQRVHLPDAQWPRVIEVRADALGLVCVVAHLQRMLEGNGRAPDFGWQIEADAADCCLCDRGTRHAIAAATLTHPFASGTPCSVTLNSDRLSLYHPTAHHKRRGGIEASCSEGKMNYRYWRCRSEEKVPMQQAAWAKAEFIVAPCGLAQLTPALEYPHDPKMDWRLWDELYATGEPLDVAAFPGCAEIVRDHHNAIVRSVCEGDDWGNITSFADDSPCGSVFGMNRLNHCPPIFEEAWRTGDRRLLDAAILWCDNFYDQSIWWGPNDTGGTRYNNILASGGTPPDNDQNYMWRSNTSVNFCTKGYDSLLMAYEQTGDPRMLEAANAQAAYAAKSVHALLETRNIGDVRDFVRLYRYTGEKRYLDESLRLFDEVRSKLSTGDLFSQSGHPLEPNPPFIEDDQVGYKHPFAKPYIIGYALAGLPDLLGIRPEEPKLKEVVKAVGDFLCESQDPLGGWRYPHPRSSATMCSQAIEHAWQIVQADRALGPDEKRLDAIERVLRQRILGWQKTRRVLSGLGGWEIATGKVKATSELYGLYKYPSDRNSHRDYAEGQITFGSSPPEGLVYFTDVLRHYLKYRKAESLLAPPRDDEPLGKVLLRVPAHVSAENNPDALRARVKADFPQVPDAKPEKPSAPQEGEKQADDVSRDSYQTVGSQDGLPVFREKIFNRMSFPLSWNSGKYQDFSSWRQAARAKVMECLLPPPPAAPFDPVILSEVERGSYIARKVMLNITADSRVLCLMTIPKGQGPFPAVLLLHDHGARFDIGKEKVIEPWDVPPAKLDSARQWVQQCYGGRFLGDELAKRGYVCLAMDMFNWSDRGGAPDLNQQALAGNLLHLGMTHAGLIAHEDLRAAEFLGSQPNVDAKRVAAMGLSVGCFRTWQLAALSDHISAGVAICWMATVKGLMVPGNNQTRGQSAYVMIHPNLFNYLDYPDVASIACPKPMLFYNGLQDGLFPAESAREAHARMRTVWESQQAGDKLVTRLWDVPHVYNVEMQNEAFDWLDRQFGVSR
jgi:hypothetical protein